MAGYFDLEHIFSYHPPTEEQTVKYAKVREAAKAFAEVIVETTPFGSDQHAALRHVREALMTATSAIALRGRLFKADPQ